MYQRAQAVLTHVRIPAQHRTGLFSSPKLDADDIAAADRFVTDATALHQASQDTTYTIRPSGQLVNKAGRCG